MRKELIKNRHILGCWESENKEVRVRISENLDTGCFNGEITWIIEDESNAEGPTLDELNPDERLRRRPIVGLKIMTGLIFSEKKKEWKGGRIYNPEDGKTYYLKAWLIDKDILKMKGSIDPMSLLSESLKWHRLSS